MYAKRSFSSADHEKGAVLIIGLIVLLLLTIIGLASIRDTSLQESMAGNLRDRNVAFQSAEAALRMAETQISDGLSESFVGDSVGYWPDLNDASNKDALTQGSWPYMSGSSGSYRLRPVTWTPAQWASNSVQLASGVIAGASAQPRYAIEKIYISPTAMNQGNGIDVESTEKYADGEYYRITAHGIGVSEDAIVTVQSTYIP